MTDEVLSQEEIEQLISGAGEGEAEAAEPKQKKQAKDAGEQPQDEPQDAHGAKAETPTITVQTDPVVRQAELGSFANSGIGSPRSSVDLILDVQLHVAVELGRATMQVRDVLSLGPGSVVELDKHAGEPVEVVVNNKVVARGEVVVIDENFGVRVTEIVGPGEREANAKAA